MKKENLGKKMTVDELMELTGGCRFGGRDGDCKCNPTEPVLKYGIEPTLKYGIEPVPEYGVEPQPLYGIEVVALYGINVSE